MLDGPPGVGTALCSRVFVYADVVDTIKALANKVTSVTGPSATAGQASIGDLVTVTVTGNTGTLGAGPAADPGVLQSTPNALRDFPVSAWRLERTEVTISPDGVAPASTFVDRLFLTGASGPAREYTARYLFRAVGPSSAPAQVKPIQYIASGTQVKHTDLGGAALYSLPAVSPVATTTLAKAVTSPADGVLPSTGGHASYALTLRNTGADADTVDYLRDTLPADAAYVAGLADRRRPPGRRPAVDGRSLVVPGPLGVPAAGTTTVRYQLLLGPTAGTRTNSAVARLAGLVLDATADVTTSAPATADVTVLGAGGPALAADSATTVAGSPVTLDVLANDSSASGRDLQVSAARRPVARDRRARRRRLRHLHPGPRDLRHGHVHLHRGRRVLQRDRDGHGDDDARSRSPTGTPPAPAPRWPAAPSWSTTPAPRARCRWSAARSSAPRRPAPSPSPRRARSPTPRRAARPAR